LLDRVLREKPDLVFYAGEAAPYGRAFELFEGLRKRGYAGRLAMGDADPEVSFLAVPARVVEGTLLISAIGPPSPEFAAAYEPATGRRAGPHAWPGYLLMKAVLAGIDRAGSCHGDKLRPAFAKDPSKPRPCALYVARSGKFEFLQDLR
jgi:ABC-type branched-subunit amino acid transport system substrate-binding protein